VNQVPSNVQAVTGETIQQQQASDLSEFLDRNVGSVNINSGQANPFMPDLNFRGFSASPLLGVPQGMSVFMDGVRINEAFGDTVNWDLIPEAVISTVNLIPGSNPVFGLNTLGGALSVNTKSGKEYPGGSLSLEGGSWGRINPTVEFGGQEGNWDFFVLGNYLEEDGWRDHSSSEIRQLFGKVGYETANFDADLNYSYADNHIEGTQTSPVSLLSVNREVPYTFPDITENRLDFLNLRLSQVFAGDKILAGNVYYRRFKSNNFSSNVNDECEDAAINPGNCSAGSPAEPQGSNDTSEIDTDGYGGTLQFTLLKQLFARDNKFTVGASYDAGRTRFTQLEQIADFSADRGTVATGPFGLETDIDTENDYYGIYATDTFSINAQTHLTLSGRFNRAEVSIRNRNPDPADDDLNGDHHFTRFNPAIGLNWNPNPRFNTWAGYNEGMRVPTPPNWSSLRRRERSLQAAQRVPGRPAARAGGVEDLRAGTRGAILRTLYSVSAYRTDLEDDIQFITVSGVNGFFDNSATRAARASRSDCRRAWVSCPSTPPTAFIDATFLDAFWWRARTTRGRCQRPHPGRVGRPHSRHPAAQLQAARRLRLHATHLRRRQLHLRQRPVRPRRREQRGRERHGAGILRRQRGRPLANHQPAAGVRPDHQPARRGVRSVRRARRKLLSGPRLRLRRGQRGRRAVPHARRPTRLLRGRALRLRQARLYRRERGLTTDRLPLARLTPIRRRMPRWRRSSREACSCLARRTAHYICSCCRERRQYAKKGCRSGSPYGEQLVSGCRCTS
jgi:hypothetical protein